MLDEREIDLWIENDLNVLFEGRHGVGKTAMVVAAFEKHNLNWKYFSAATMDPWVDFVGVPMDSIDEDGKHVLDLVRPRGFHNGTVEAIFMDELNRAPKKVRNAVMELIQFKSINGVKFPKLRFIWAAINPEDEDADVKYDVDALDPAQRDRFHICIDIPYKPSVKYFRDMYGDAGEGAIEWWGGLKIPHKNLVSPRRLEYAVKVWQMGGSVRHVLKDKQLNASALVTLLEAGSIKKKLKQLLTSTTDEKRQAFNNINFTTNAFPIIIRSSKQIEAYAEFLPKDMLSGAIVKGDKASCEIVKYAPEALIEPILKSIAVSGSLSKRKMSKLGSYINYDFTKHIPPVIPSNRPSTASYTELLIEYYKQTNTCHANSTHQRIEALKDIFSSAESFMPRDNKKVLITMLMFISAVIARTQQATLNRGGHEIPSLITEIMAIFTNRTRNMGLWPSDIWKIVKKEITSTGPNKMYVSGKGKGKVFEAKDIAKIERFLRLS